MAPGLGALPFAVQPIRPVHLITEMIGDASIDDQHPPATGPHPQLPDQQSGQDGFSGGRIAGQNKS